MILQLEISCSGESTSSLSTFQNHRLINNTYCTSTVNQSSVRTKIKQQEKAGHSLQIRPAGGEGRGERKGLTVSQGRRRLVRDQAWRGKQVRIWEMKSRGQLSTREVEEQ